MRAYQSLRIGEYQLRTVIDGMRPHVTADALVELPQRRRRQRRSWGGGGGSTRVSSALHVARFHQFRMVDGHTHRLKRSDGLYNQQIIEL